MKAFRFAIALFFASSMLLGSYSAKGQGIVTYRCSSSADMMVKKLEKSITSKGLTLVGTVSYGSNTGESSTIKGSVVEFQDQNLIDQLLECDQTTALEFPMKIMVWQEEADVFVGFIDPNLTFDKYFVGGCKETIDSLAKLNFRIVNECLRKDASEQ